MSPDAIVVHAPVEPQRASSSVAVPVMEHVSVVCASSPEIVMLDDAAVAVTPRCEQDEATVPALLQVSTVMALLSSQSVLERHVIAVCAQDEAVVPALPHVSAVRLLLSLQSVSVLQAIEV